MHLGVIRILQLSYEYIHKYEHSNVRTQRYVIIYARPKTVTARAVRPYCLESRCFKRALVITYNAGPAAHVALQTHMSWHMFSRTCALLTWLGQVQDTTAASNPAGGKGVLLLYFNTHLLEFYEEIKEHNVRVLLKAWCRI